MRIWKSPSGLFSVGAENFSPYQFANGVFYDVIHDIDGRVINATCLPYFGLFFNNSTVTSREADYLPRNCSYTCPRISAERTENSYGLSG